MNNSKIWLVVKPTVGIPLFLSAVAVGSFAVHVAVVTNTSWVADFLSGEELGSGMAAVETDDALIKNANATVLPEGAQIIEASAEGGELVILPDGRVARILTTDAVTLAAAE